MRSIFSERKRIISGFIISFFLLASSHILLFFISEIQVRSSKAVLNTNNALKQIEIVKSLLIDAETGVRGFVITGDDRFLKYYYICQQRIYPAIDQLQILSAGEKQSQPLLQSLRIKIQQRMASLTETKNDFIKARKITDTIRRNKEINERKMDTIRAVIHAIYLQKTAEESYRCSKYNQLILLSRNAIIVSFFIALLTLAYALFLYSRQVKQQKEEQQEKVRYKQLLAEKITETNLLQERIQTIKNEHQDMDSITKIALHDVRNPLSTISMASDQMKNTSNDINELEMLHAMIKNNVEQINKILTGILLSARTAGAKQKYDVNALLEEALARAQSRLQLTGVKVFRNMGKDLPPLAVDAEKIISALLNFIINAVEAMPSGRGILLVSTCRRMNAVIIGIEDNGQGMDSLTLSKIFTPYFTLKKNGLGIGMPSAQYVIKKHTGKLVIKSKPGHGTLVHIFLRIS